MNSYTKNILYTNNRDCIQTFCNDRRNTLHFACRQWYSYFDNALR